MKDNSLTPPLKAIYLVPQSMITITEEGLRLRVDCTLSAYKERSELTAKLIGSFTFFVSVLLSFLATSEFRSFVFPSSVWTAFFLFCLVFSLGASLYFAVRLYRTKKPDDLISGIIKDSSSLQTAAKGKFKLEEAPDWLITPSPWTPEK